MVTVTFTRVTDSDEGTFGKLETDNGFSCFTLELPWRDNKKRISCIPEGEYAVEVRRSPRFGLVYHVKDVYGRSYILIHSGNFAGDVSKGYKSHVEGCILLGKKVGILDGQKAVLVSKPAVTSFMRHLNNKPFKLVIKHV